MSNIYFRKMASEAILVDSVIRSWLELQAQEPINPEGERAGVWRAHPSPHPHPHPRERWALSSWNYPVQRTQSVQRPRDAQGSQDPRGETLLRVFEPWGFPTLTVLSLPSSLADPGWSRGMERTRVLLWERSRGWVKQANLDLQPWGRKWSQRWNGWCWLERGKGPQQPDACRGEERRAREVSLSLSQRQGPWGLTSEHPLLPRQTGGRESEGDFIKARAAGVVEFTSREPPCLSPTLPPPHTDVCWKSAVFLVLHM